MPPTAARVDPLRNFNYAVELDDITQAGFTECSGFGSTTEPVEYNEGGLNSHSRKFVGRTKQNNIVLKWGTTDSTELYDWYQQTLDGQIERKNGSIILFDNAGEEKARWDFFRAWPTRWDGPALSASGNEVAIETLEIAHEGLTRA
ncbi:MAG: phage tail protein [Planctomycetota bacterium]